MQKHLNGLILVLSLLLASGLWAQEERIVIKKEIHEEDQNQGTKDGDESRVIKKIIHMGAEGADKDGLIWISEDEGGVHADIDVEVILDTDSLLQDLGDKVVMIQKKHRGHQPPAKVIILKSGFFRRDTTIVYYDPLDRTILKVIDDGQEMDAGEFHKYRDQLDGAMEMAELEDLEPRIEDLEIKLSLPDFPDSLKLKELDSLLVELKELDSKQAKLNLEKLISTRTILFGDVQQPDFPALLEKAGINISQGVTTLRIEKGKISINGEPISPEQQAAFDTVYEEAMGEPLSGDDVLELQFDWQEEENDHD